MSRLYITSTAFTDGSPTPVAGWENTASGIYVQSGLTKASSAMTTKQVTLGGSANDDYWFLTAVTAPLASGSLFTTGDVIKAQIRANEANANMDAKVDCGVRIFNQAMDTVRATLRTIFQSGSEPTTTYRNITLSTTSSSTYTTVTGDRVVMEFGGRKVTNIGAFQLSYGDDSATDLGENETDTSAFNPWLEFPSTTISLASSSNYGGKAGTTASQSRRLRI